MLQKIKGICFDKDGTLFDFQRSWAASFSRSLDALSRGDRALRQRLSGAMGFDPVAGRFLPESSVIAAPQEVVLAALGAVLPDWGRQDILAVMIKETESASMVAVPGLRDILYKIWAQNIALGLVTNDSEAAAQRHLDAEGVRDHFSFIAGYDSGFGAKPEPGQLLAFAEFTGLAPEALVMVGDSPADLLAARAAGFFAMGVLTGVAPRSELTPLADLVLDDISGILPLLT